MSTLPALHLESQNGIATLTLDRPERHNAFDANTLAALDAVLDRLACDASQRVLILAARGPSFCAGADLEWMKAAAHHSPEKNLQDARQLAGVLHKLATLNKPTLARVQGSAYGGGVGLIAACDIAIATPQAHFALSEVKLGLIPAAISPYVLRAIGARAAHRYLLTAERFSAQTAREMGLLHEIVADEATLDNALHRLAHTLLKNGPEALAACKQLITHVRHHQLDAALIEETAQRIAHLRAGEEAQEGMAAFLEHRPPRWCPQEEQESCSKKS